MKNNWKSGLVIERKCSIVPPCRAYGEGFGWFYNTYRPMNNRSFAFNSRWALTAGEDSKITVRNRFKLDEIVDVSSFVNYNTFLDLLLYLKDVTYFYFLLYRSSIFPSVMTPEAVPWFQLLLPTSASSWFLSTSIPRSAFGMLQLGSW